MKGEAMRVYTASEVAKLVRTSDSTLARWIEIKIFPAPACRAGRRAYYTQEQYDQIKESMQTLNTRQDDPPFFV